MPSVDRDALVALADHNGWPSVSLYLPTHRAGSEKEQDRIRLKNLVRSACEHLIRDGMRDADAEAFCSPARAILDDATFWRGTTEGLALFISPDGMTVAHTDAPLPEQSVVGDRYYLRPLMAAHRGDRRFFALAIDRGGCRLFRGDGASIDQIPLEGAPASLADELQYDETQESIQYSSQPSPASAAGGGRASSAIYHGHGGEKDTDKSNLERYLRKVEAAVAKTLACHSGVPLVLLGVEYELAAYRSLNSCPSIAEEAIFGATDEMQPHRIHARSLVALEPRFATAMETELADLAEKEGSPLASHDAVEIVAAAASGRVKALFFDDSVGPFGTFDRESFEVDMVCADAPRFLRESGEADGGPADGECGWDLVDLAAAETALHGGEVHAFTGEDAPVHGVAAVYRY